jgi:hypothetical protein
MRQLILRFGVGTFNPLMARPSDYAGTVVAVLKFRPLREPEPV